ncbi:MAG: DUF4920 domain-containing protein [Polyangiaceae bacterium]|jgi:hypothetical protein
MRAIRALCIPLLALGCHAEAAKPTAGAAGPSAPTTSVSSFGSPIAERETLSLGDIARSPAAYRGKLLATHGTVTRVCQERGCWMAIQDDSGSATVRMHGHGFFVPTTSTGKRARVEGTVVLMKDGRECDDLAAIDATLEIDATGVELM